jgi:hypothetical protein
LRRELAGAVTALQFQDMAAQVISHTVQRIRGVADFLGARAVADDDEAAASRSFSWYAGIVRSRNGRWMPARSNCFEPSRTQKTRSTNDGCDSRCR